MQKNGSEIREVFLLFRHEETLKCSKISQTCAKKRASQAAIRTIEAFFARLKKNCDLKP